MHKSQNPTQRNYEAQNCRLSVCPHEQAVPVPCNGKMNNQSCLLSVIGTNLTRYSDRSSACQSTGRDVWKLIGIDGKWQLLDKMMCQEHS